MANKRSVTYKEAGVDIEAGADLATHFADLMQATFSPQVIANPGGFGGLYRLRGTPGLFARRYADPVLVSGTDGVGTKLKIAFALQKHDTIGIDLVAMSVNDILVQGAEPLFFLDYLATGRIDRATLLAVVEGVAAGCCEAGCALLGGETAELPGFYQEGEYDLAGFAVGVVERRRLIDGSSVKPGDVVIGLPSAGLHANGYSLARRVLLDDERLDLTQTCESLDCTLGEELLRPTRIYTRPVLAVLQGYRRKKPVHALAHITGGGLLDNIPRALPQHCNAVLQKGSWPVPPVFELIQRCGRVDPNEMFRVFNMGLGMVLIVAPVSANAILARLKRAGCPGYAVGKIVKGKGTVTIRS